MRRTSVSRRKLMTISVGLWVLAAMTVVLVPKRALADKGVPLRGAFTVQAELITAITTCAPGDTNCSACLNNSGIYVEAQGIGDTSLGTVFLKILKCFNPAGGSFGTYAGTFTMTAPNGKDSITGSYLGQNDNAGDAYGFGPFSGQWTITAGTGKFEGANGSASFTAVAGPITAGPSSNSNMLTAFYSVQGKLALPGHD
jgi:hypothetical protein